MALKICSIASGSKGNCYYVKSNRTSLIVDLGISYKRMAEALSSLGERVPEHVFITHTHSDHIAGLRTASKNGMVIHACSAVENTVRRSVSGCILESINPDNDFFLSDITVSSTSVSHDVPCVSYSFISEGKKLSILTDLGTISESVFKSVCDADMVVLESNYDEDMLRQNTSYPVELKYRIAGKWGHLSNKAAAETAVKLAESGVKKIMLAHLSENNNTPELAYSNVRAALVSHRYNDIELYVAGQNFGGEVIEI